MRPGPYTTMIICNKVERATIEQVTNTGKNTSNPWFVLEREDEAQISCPMGMKWFDLNKTD